MCPIRPSARFTRWANTCFSHWAPLETPKGFPVAYDFRQFKPLNRLDVKPRPVILKPQAADREPKPEPRLPEHPGKNGQGRTATEEGFPVVDPGADFVPDILSQYT
jgi:hypothetical protein